MFYSSVSRCIYPESPLNLLEELLFPDLNPSEASIFFFFLSLFLLFRMMKTKRGECLTKERIKEVARHGRCFVHILHIYTYTYLYAFYTDSVYTQIFLYWRFKIRYENIDWKANSTKNEPNLFRTTIFLISQWNI